MLILVELMLGVNNIVIEKKHCHWQIDVLS
jgi:hypothetical protein